MLKALPVARRVRDYGSGLEYDALRAIGSLWNRVGGGDRAVLSSRLRLLAVTPGFPPWKNAGSEISLKLMLAHFAQRGHQVRVLVGSGACPGFQGGLEVMPQPGIPDVFRHYRWCDVVVTQLESFSQARKVSLLCGRPLVQLLRMGGPATVQRRAGPDLLVFNSDWLWAEWRDRMERAATPSLVVHPMICVDHCRVRCPGDAITMINLNEHKGARTFFELARRMPDRRFLGVEGGWGDQLPPPSGVCNVQIIPSTSDMHQVYSRTRILLVPSRHESFGRVALEAAASGIPTIAHPSAGVLEALDDAGLYADREDVDAWIRAIASLDDPKIYLEASERARSRLAAINSDGELFALEQALYSLRNRNMVSSPCQA